MQPGDNLAQFEIIRLIGAGGMGEVYLARDTILDRDVAVKILPAEWAEDTERLGRFRREARVLASLNHPNIASIFGLDEAAGRTFLVMELVQGQDLSQVMQAGPVPLDQAVGIAVQIATGLEEAHAKGFIHRDLHEPRAGSRPRGGRARRHLGLRLHPAGDAHRPLLLRRRHVQRHPGHHPEDRPGLG